jgi:hypothetical protein
MHAVDHRIGGVVAIGGELDEVAKVDKRHGRLYSDVAIIGRRKSRRHDGEGF